MHDRSASASPIFSTNPIAAAAAALTQSGRSTKRDTEIADSSHQCANPARTASSNTSASTGLCRNAIAPPLKAGPVGVVLQSGALASAVLAFAQGHAIGLSLLVAMGNETMISVTDVVDYLLEDDSTRSIALFLESIRHPDELRRVAEKAYFIPTKTEQVDWRTCPDGR